MITHWPTMKRCAAIAKKEISYAGPFGVVARLCGTIFIERDCPNNSHSTMNQAAETVRQKKVIQLSNRTCVIQKINCLFLQLKLWVFPEGTRCKGTEMLPFKKGAFYIAIAAQLPISPVVYSRYHFLDHKQKRFDPGEVVMTVLPPISTKGMTMDELPELMDRVRNLMMETYHATSTELNNAHAIK